MKKNNLLLILLLLTSFCFGQNLTDFTLQSVTDNSKFTLSAAKGKFVALHFLLKTECPYCIRHTNDYFEKSKSMPGVVQVFIKPDNEAEIKEWMNKLSKNEAIQYQIYQDVNAQLATALNIPDGYSFHGQTVHYPALLIINPEGKEVFRYIGKNNSDRYSFEQFKMKIEELLK